jgi:hypothetical protein
MRTLRGSAWADLIDRIAKLPDGHEDVLGLSLLAIRMASCLTCDLDSYRASLGCCTCACRTIAGFKGTDAELIRKFEETRDEVHEYVQSGRLPEAIARMVKQSA